MRYHAATHFPAATLPDDPANADAVAPSEYCGIVDQAHLDLVRELAAHDDVPRIFTEHPRNLNEFFVLRADGLLDHYVGIFDDEEVE